MSRLAPIVMTAVLALVAGCSSAGGGGPLNPQASLDVLVLDPTRHLADTEASARALLRELKESGYTQAALAYTRQTEADLDADFSPLFAAADDLGFGLWLGLKRERMVRHFWDEDNVSAELADNTALIDRLEALYGGHASLRGYWVNHETTAWPDDSKRRQIGPLIQGIGGYLAQHYPGRKLVARMRYPGTDLSLFDIAYNDTRVDFDSIDDSADIGYFATLWADIAADAGLHALVVEAQNGSQRLTATRRATLVNALNQALSARGIGLAVLADLFTTLPDTPAIRPVPVTARPDFEALAAMKDSLPEGVALWGFDEGSLASLTAAVPARDAHLGLPADLLATTYDNALWVENHLESTVWRDGQVVTVAEANFDIERDGNLWQEDACWLTGLLCSALSYKYQVTGDPRDRKKAAHAFNTLMAMATATPLKGEVVRNFVSSLYGQTDPVQPDWSTIKRWHKHPDREIWWVGDISVDQMSGWMHGVSTYFDLVANEAEKARAAEVVDAVARTILENDLHAKEFNGLNTTYGNFNTEPLMALDLAAIAAHITGDRYFTQTFDQFVAAGKTTAYLAKIYLQFQIPGQCNFQHFADAVIYQLNMWTTDQGVSLEVQSILQYLYQRSFNYGFAWADFNYAAFEPKSEGLTRGLWQLYNYQPRYLENRYYLWEVNKRYESGFVPMEVRPTGEYEWHTGLEEDGGAGPRGGADHRFSGVGYLLAYWMARYHQLLPPPLEP